jgi:large subunit ribosomal protein L4
VSTIDVRTRGGGNAGTVELPDAIFGIQPNVPVMHQVVTAQLAAARSGTQSTKTRAEVSGGGAKPWRQKGTGRARQGSTRAPHWAGGGVALGPKPRKYNQKTPKKMIQLALRSALSDRASEGKVMVIDEWGWEAPSTKNALAALDVLGLEGRILVVLDRDDEIAYKSFRNIGAVQPMFVGELNAYDILVNDWIVFTTSTVPTGEPRNTDAPVHEPVVAADEVVNTAAPQVGLTADSVDTESSTEATTEAETATEQEEASE